MDGSMERSIYGRLDLRQYIVKIFYSWFWRKIPLLLVSLMDSEIRI